MHNQILIWTKNPNSMWKPRSRLCWGELWCEGPGTGPEAGNRPQHREFWVNKTQSTMQQQLRLVLCSCPFHCLQHFPETTERSQSCSNLMPLHLSLYFTNMKYLLGTNTAQVWFSNEPSQPNYQEGKRPSTNQGNGLDLWPSAPLSDIVPCLKLWSSQAIRFRTGPVSYVLPTGYLSGPTLTRIPFQIHSGSLGVTRANYILLPTHH